MRNLTLVVLWVLSTTVMVLVSVNYSYKKGVEDSWVHVTAAQMWDQLLYDKIIEISGTNALRETLRYDLYATISGHRYSMMTQSILSKALGPERKIRNNKEPYISKYKQIQEHLDYKNKDLVWLMENLE